MPRPAPFVFVLAALVVLAVAVAAVFGGDGESTPVPVEPAAIPTPPGTKLPPLEDPFAYDPDHREDFEARAAAGNAHALYALSPGGAVATAKRVALWRDEDRGGRLEGAAWTPTGWRRWCSSRAPDGRTRSARRARRARPA